VKQLIGNATGEFIRPTSQTAMFIGLIANNCSIVHANNDMCCGGKQKRS